jgi:hypothetical protein
VDVSLQDIERRGSLVVDHRHPNGSQVIVWVQ